MRRIVSTIGSNVASPLIESMDINAIVNEINWNDVIQQIDFNKIIESEQIDLNLLLDNIDVNRVLDRVDVNRHLSRVNYDQHLDNVDLNALIAKSNLEEIIARSTSGVFSGIINLLRTRMAWIDQWGQRLIGKFCCLCGCCGYCFSCFNSNTQENIIIHYLPPRPGRHPQDSYTEWKNSTKQLNQREYGKLIQFRCCGAINRILSDAIDNGIIWITLTILAILILKLGDILTDDDTNMDELSNIFMNKDTNNTTTTNNATNATIADINIVSNIFTSMNSNDDYNDSGWWIGLIIWMIYSYTYYVMLIGCFGRTIGMWILGIVMVDKNGNRISFYKVCIQGLLDPLNKIFFGWIVSFIRRDGKMWSDLIGNTAIVYAWDSTSYIVDSKNNAEMAMSLTDFVNVINVEEQEQAQEIEQEATTTTTTTTNPNGRRKYNNSSNRNSNDDDYNDDDIELGMIHR